MQIICNNAALEKLVKQKSRVLLGYGILFISNFSLHPIILQQTFSLSLSFLRRR